MPKHDSKNGFERKYTRWPLFPRKCNIDDRLIAWSTNEYLDILLCGNHGSRRITPVHGFYGECQQITEELHTSPRISDEHRYGSLSSHFRSSTERRCACMVDSPDICTLDQIRVLSRAQEIPHEGAFCDLMWLDLDDIDNWAVSPRGAGWLFGGRVTREEGYKYMFGNALVTVWCAPNYCYRCGNMAPVLTLREGGEHDFKVFGPAPGNKKDKG